MKEDKNKHSQRTMEDVTPIANVFKEYRAYYMRRKKELKEELKELPLKGSVIKKKVKGHYYYYLVYREGEKVKFDYLGKIEPANLKEQIEKRRWIIKQLRKIDNALYALGVAKRTQSLGLAKRFAVFERDKFTCQYCGRNVKDHKAVLVVDHINPKKRGGGETLDNLITSCVECNSGKRARLMKDLI
jgi:hypothetical protein